MDSLMFSVGIVIVGATALVMFGIYSVYGGSRASLCEAKPGQVYNFEYLQPLNGDSKRVLARVLEPGEGERSPFISGSRANSTLKSK